MHMHARLQRAVGWSRVWPRSALHRALVRGAGSTKVVERHRTIVQTGSRNLHPSLELADGVGGIGAMTAFEHNRPQYADRPKHGRDMRFAGGLSVGLVSAILAGGALIAPVRDSGSDDARQAGHQRGAVVDLPAVTRPENAPGPGGPSIATPISGSGAPVAGGPALPLAAPLLGGDGTGLRATDGGRDAAGRPADPLRGGQVGGAVLPDGRDEVSAGSAASTLTAETPLVDPAWQARYDVDLNNLHKDSDGDGLTDLTESVLNTNPYKVDSDGDGTPDGANSRLRPGRAARQRRGQGRHGPLRRGDRAGRRRRRGRLRRRQAHEPDRAERGHGHRSRRLRRRRRPGQRRGQRRRRRRERPGAARQHEPREPGLGRRRDPGRPGRHRRAGPGTAARRRGLPRRLARPHRRRRDPRRRRRPHRRRRSRARPAARRRPGRAARRRRRHPARRHGDRGGRAGRRDGRARDARDARRAERARRDREAGAEAGRARAEG